MILKEVSEDEIEFLTEEMFEYVQEVCPNFINIKKPLYID